MTAMIDAVLDLAPHHRRRLADALERATLPVPCKPVTVRAVLGLDDGADDVVFVVDGFRRMGLNGTAAAAWLRALDEAGARHRRPDLVWSGPKVDGVHARDTRSVYEELLRNAQRSLWACSYAYYDGKKAFKALADRMDERPELDVVLMLNIERPRGNTSSADALVRRFADRLWTREWPGTNRPQVYYDPRALEPDGPAGVLHAKGVIVDRESVFVTSANFTEAAWDRNVELGVVLRDHALATAAVSHLSGLIHSGQMAALPED